MAANELDFETIAADRDEAHSLSPAQVEDRYQNALAGELR